MTATKKITLRVTGPEGVVATRKTHKAYSHVLFGFSSGELRARRYDRQIEQDRVYREADGPAYAAAYDRRDAANREAAAEARAKGDYWTWVSWHSRYELAVKAANSLLSDGRASFTKFEIVPVAR